MMKRMQSFNLEADLTGASTASKSLSPLSVSVCPARQPDRYSLTISCAHKDLMQQSAPFKEPATLEHMVGMHTLDLGSAHVFSRAWRLHIRCHFVRRVVPGMRGIGRGLQQSTLR